MPMEDSHTVPHNGDRYAVVGAGVAQHAAYGVKANGILR